MNKMNNANIHPVILCGGSGTRLWPVSRAAFPKQFVKLHGDGSLFQQASSRLSGEGFYDPLIVTSVPFRFTAQEQLNDIGIQHSGIMLEPEGRNTAPAVLAASLLAAQRDPNAVLLIASSDHVVSDPAAFRDAVKAALPSALSGNIVTFGIRPDRPETGYGYLELEEKDVEVCAPLKRFVEKPDLADAEAMLAAGTYLWNAGIFLFRADTILEAFQKYEPNMVTHAEAAIRNSKQDLGFLRLDPEAWSRLNSISIDYAIMEKADNLSVMPYNGHWSDLGSWSAVADQSAEAADENGNVVSNSAIAIDCHNSLLRTEDEGPRLIGIGLEDMVAVATGDAVLLAHKDQSQRVREAVDLLKKEGAKEATEFSRDFRPWGWFESLAMGARFQVKRIVVKPGGILSLQSHKFRAEHWIVVEGTAKVTIGDDVKLVSENQSVYVPLGAIHRLENPGDVPMVLIEVQTGSYLGEDDIIRHEDVYART
ncbi:mannose-1-phosphate guanylyltransferase/mannose-6-phosphate isomerase [Roseobacter sp. HKCC-CH-9208]|uniref:mannose-1-phosphate guanylyltransferase/mannose-6-phosphate isomerase n=1 Tax=Roseobacter sp. HKCC-CH-9208 TaxID=3120339 RepID=UPI0030EB37D3